MALALRVCAINGAFDSVSSIYYLGLNSIEKFPLANVKK